MLRRLVFAAMLVVSAAWGSTDAAAGSKPPPPTCADFLNGHLYSCTFTPESLIAEHRCIFAATDIGDQVGLDFGAGVIAHCNCNPTGSGKTL